MSSPAAETIPLDDKLDFEHTDYDEDLRAWGRWHRENAGSLPDLGYPKTNVLHPTHGLGGSGSGDEALSDRVKEVDRIIMQLPKVLRRVAHQYWNFQDTKVDICIRLTVYFGVEAKPKKVKSYHVDQWLGEVAMAVWFGIDRGKGKL